MALAERRELSSFITPIVTHGGSLKEACARCKKPLEICVCDRATPLHVKTRVIILQHPEEQDIALSTAPILSQMVNARIIPGVMWRSSEQAAGEALDPNKWGVVYPHFSPAAPALHKPYQVLTSTGASSSKRLEGLIALDGTWDQARTLWWQNPWLHSLLRVVLQPTEPSIYGKLRREPHKGGVSTLEAIAEALVGNGEEPATREALRRVMRTMIQRSRDAATKK
jgi:DTW domain-containing protein